MAEEAEPDGIVPVNDNRNPGGDADIASCEKLDRAVLSIARLIGREQFEALQAANDNKAQPGEARYGSRLSPLQPPLSGFGTICGRAPGADKSQAAFP